MTDHVWLDLTSALSAESDAELREDAADLLSAESARCRLVDRVGPAVLRLDDGTVVRGSLCPDVVEGWLSVDDGADEVLVNLLAVVTVEGSRPGLRREDTRVPMTIGSWLRAAQAEQVPLRAVLPTGGAVAGSPTFVGADHVELVGPVGTVIVRMAAVRLWERRA